MSIQGISNPHRSSRCQVVPLTQPSPKFEANNLPQFDSWKQVNLTHLHQHPSASMFGSYDVDVAVVACGVLAIQADATYMSQLPTHSNLYLLLTQPTPNPILKPILTHPDNPTPAPNL